MKLTDIKKYLTDFTLINLAFHARAMEMYTCAHQQLLNINIAHDLEEFRTAVPFHRLHPSQRNVSETALNNPKRPITGGLSGEYSGSMSALPDHRHDTNFGSRYSLPTESNVYRGGSLERGDHRKSQPARGGLHSLSPTHEHSSKHGTTTNATNKNKTAKPNVAESYSSDTTESDE